MAKTMEIFGGLVLALMLVLLIGATSMEELERKDEKLEAELAQLKEMFSNLQMKLNDTEELEARVSVLEESMVEVEEDVVVLQTSVINLADEVDNVESINILQEETINILEVEINDNENDIEELVDVTTGLTGQILGLEVTVEALDQRVGDLESGGGGSGNITDLEERVDSLEEVTSQLTDDVSSLEDNDVTQDQRISGIEEDMTSLDQRVEDLESGGSDLEERVESLEEVTSQFGVVTAALDVRVSDTEEEIVSLNQRVEDLESGIGNANTTDYGDTAFLAALASSVGHGENPLIFEWEAINHGGHYSNITGKYTAPYDGIYQFSVHLINAADDSDVLIFEILVDDSVTGSHDDAWQHEDYRFTTVLLELQAGQTVHVSEGGGVLGHPTYLRSYFSGYMISAN